MNQPNKAHNLFPCKGSSWSLTEKAIFLTNEVQAM